MSDEQAPQRIWLQWHGWNEKNTWCVFQINDEDVEYVRADKVLALGAELATLRTQADPDALTAAYQLGVEAGKRGTWQPVEDGDYSDCAGTWFLIEKNGDELTVDASAEQMYATIDLGDVLRLCRRTDAS